MQEVFPNHVIALVNAKLNFEIAQYCKISEEPQYPIIHVYHKGKHMLEITKPNNLYDIQIIINVMVAEQEMKGII